MIFHNTESHITKFPSDLKRNYFVVSIRISTSMCERCVKSQKTSQ